MNVNAKATMDVRRNNHFPNLGPIRAKPANDPSTIISVEDSKKL